MTPAARPGNDAKQATDYTASHREHHRRDSVMSMLL